MANDFWRGRRVLVTGANGFIGGWLIRTLVDLGAVVTGYDKSERGALDLHRGLQGEIQMVLGDLTDQERFQATLAERQIRTLYHLGAQSNIGIARGSPVPAFDSNIRGSWTVLDACRTYGELETIAVASSNTVYGEHEESPFTESFPLDGDNPYAASKACTDILARCYARTWGLPIAIARATNTYGGADPNLTRIVPGTVLAILRGERPEIRSDGSPTKGYLYVNDTVEAYRLLGERAAEPEVRGQPINFHPDRPTSVLELVQTIVEVAERPDLEPNVTGTSGNREYEHLSNDRARDVLGWTPRYSLADGLRETVAWYRHHKGAELERAARAFGG